MPELVEIIINGMKRIQEMTPATHPFVVPKGPMQAQGMPFIPGVNPYIQPGFLFFVSYFFFFLQSVCMCVCVCLNTHASIWKYEKKNDTKKNQNIDYLGPYFNMNSKKTTPLSMRKNSLLRVLQKRNQKQFNGGITNDSGGIDSGSHVPMARWAVHVKSHLLMSDCQIKLQTPEAADLDIHIIDLTMVGNRHTPAAMSYNNNSNNINFNTNMHVVTPKGFTNPHFNNAGAGNPGVGVGVGVGSMPGVNTAAMEHEKIYTTVTIGKFETQLSLPVEVDETSATGLYAV